MKSDCCFDEGRLVPGRIKRAAIVSFALMLLVAACVAALTYTVRSSSSSSNEADKDLPVLKIGVTKTVISIACGVIILPVIARISITGPSRI